MTLKELLEALQLDDCGKPLPLDAEVRFHTGTVQDMHLLSVYEDNSVVHIDIGRE